MERTVCLIALVSVKMVAARIVCAMARFVCLFVRMSLLVRIIALLFVVACVVQIETGGLTE